MKKTHNKKTFHFALYLAILFIHSITADNMLTGTIPLEFEDMENLEKLYLRKFSFAGYIAE